MITLSNKNYSAIGNFSLLCAVVMILALFASCAPQHARGKVPSYRTHGTASWYGPGFYGKRTANGEKYNAKAMTAAHRTLPFNTTLKVTNLDNGKSVVVRINDRGPFIRGRVIDLSKKAAQELGLIGTGTAEVELVAIAAKRGEESQEIKKGPANKKKKKKKLSDPALETGEEMRFNPPPDSSKELENLYEQQGDVMEKEGMPPEDDNF